MGDIQNSDSGRDGDEQYGAVEAGDGQFVIYDREKKTAWIQSTHTVDVRE